MSKNIIALIQNLYLTGSKFFHQRIKNICLLIQSIINFSCLDPTSNHKSNNSGLSRRTPLTIFIASKWCHLTMISHYQQYSILKKSSFLELEIKFCKTLIHIAKCRISCIPIRSRIGRMRRNRLQTNKIRRSLSSNNI